LWKPKSEKKLFPNSQRKGPETGKETSVGQRASREESQRRVRMLKKKVAKVDDKKPGEEKGFQKRKVKTRKGSIKIHEVLSAVVRAVGKEDNNVMEREGTLGGPKKHADNYFRGVRKMADCWGGARFKKGSNRRDSRNI